MKLAGKRFSFIKHAATIGATLVLFVSLLITLSHAALAAPQPSIRALKPADMQNLIFVWASGTTSLQQQASHICQADSISPENCAAISAAGFFFGVAAGWAANGRPTSRNTKHFAKRRWRREVKAGFAC